jgi:hypothetical protein
MDFFTFVYRWSSRDLRKIILLLLKLWLAENIKRINYVQNYSFDDKSVKKNEEKLILISTKDYDKLMEFLSKNFPQIERIKQK